MKGLIQGCMLQPLVSSSGRASSSHLRAALCNALSIRLIAVDETVGAFIQGIRNFWTSWMTELYQIVDLVFRLLQFVRKDQLIITLAVFMMFLYNFLGMTCSMISENIIDAGKVINRFVLIVFLASRFVSTQGKLNLSSREFFSILREKLHRETDLHVLIHLIIETRRWSA